MFTIYSIEAAASEAATSRGTKPKSRLSSVSPESHDCRYCSRSFSKQYNLLIHERTHKQQASSEAANPPLCLSMCDICGKVFRKAESMRNHR